MARRLCRIKKFGYSVPLNLTLCEQLYSDNDLENKQLKTELAHITMEGTVTEFWLKSGNSGG